MKNQTFVVVDTEGNELLKEIAIIDAEGKQIYQAFIEEHPDNYALQVNRKALKTVASDFLSIAYNCLIICHHAQHDQQVLRIAFRAVNLKWPKLKFVCSCELARQYFPNLASYSLEYLSKKFNLQVNQKYFNPKQAHSAKYDAEFTYQLYRKILDMQQLSALKTQPNPFSSSRVDNPFQDHPDQSQVYQNEFERLKTTLNDIRRDQNHQSRGAVVIGEAGSGKTHLTMRLAKELLKINRLVFIGCPNNSNTVLHHTYTEILKSLIQTVPENGYTQLENLLAHSFVKLISTSRHINLIKNDQAILEAVKDNPLNLYALGVEGTERKRNLWQHIERRTNEWWMNQYGFAGYGAQIIKGIIKFCSFTEPRRKQFAAQWLAGNELDVEALELVNLVNWSEDLSKEEFSLEAISVFSKLSLLDEPLIVIFDQVEAMRAKHNENLLLNFGEALKEIFTKVPNSLIILNLFPDSWEHFQQFFNAAVVDRLSEKLYLHRPDQQTLHNILQIRAEALGIDLNTLFSANELETILSQNSIRKVLNQASDYFRYKVHGIPLQNSLAQQSAVPASEVSASHRVNPVSEAGEASVEQRLARLEAGFTEFRQIFKQIASAFQEVAVTEIPSETPITTSAIHPVKPPISPLTPLLQYLKTQQQRLEQNYAKPQILTDSDDLGKLITIAEAFKSLYSLEIDYLQLGKRKLPEHLVLQSARRAIAVGFLQINGSGFTNRIKNWNDLVLYHKQMQFQLWRDIRQPAITGKVGNEEIEKLNYADNGAFLPMEKEQRLDFELIYQLVTDIQNRDLEIELSEALQALTTERKDSWICQLLQTL